MTALKSHRSLALALVLSLVAVSTLPPPVGLRSGPPAGVEVPGSAPYPILACAGCVAGGVFLTLGGWASVLAAASRPGSALAVAACGYACYRAVAW